jgi:hypothetical protein
MECEIPGPGQASPASCHPERSEGSLLGSVQILRCAQDDSGAQVHLSGAYRVSTLRGDTTSSSDTPCGCPVRGFVQGDGTPARGVATAFTCKDAELLISTLVKAHVYDIMYLLFQIMFVCSNKFDVLIASRS